LAPKWAIIERKWTGRSRESTIILMAPVLSEGRVKETQQISDFSKTGFERKINKSCC
jgi:hypothetical protein